MEIQYKNSKVKAQCTNTKDAQLLFGGDKQLVKSLMSRIFALQGAETLKDIVVLKQIFRFHALKNKDGRDLEGYFAIDVKTKKEPWRIVILPLKENGEKYIPCNIDEIANDVVRIEIVEVSKHYE